MGLILDIAEAEHLQPDQQRVRCRHREPAGVQFVKGSLKMDIPRRKAAPLVARPHVLRLKAQSRLKSGKAAGAGKIQLIQPCKLVKAHEFVIDLNRRILGIFGNNPRYNALDSGRTVAFQHTHPFVALLHIKAAHIFTAPDRIPNALVAQMGFTKADPFAGKFRVHAQQRHEIPRQRCLPARALGADDLLRGDIHHPHLHPACHHGQIQHLVQCRRVGVAAVDNCGFIISLTQL